MDKWKAFALLLFLSSLTAFVASAVEHRMWQNGEALSNARRAFEHYCTDVGGLLELGIT